MTIFRMILGFHLMLTWVNAKLNEVPYPRATSALTWVLEGWNSEKQTICTVVLSAVENYWNKVCPVLEFSTWSYAEANGTPRVVSGMEVSPTFLRAWRKSSLG